MTVRLEHANLAVHDIDAVICFLQTAFLEFRIRHDTTEPDGVRWVHVGTDDTYIALNQAKGAPGVAQRGMPLNHLAFDVTDIESICARLLHAGYQQNTFTPRTHPHRQRVYFFDPEGNEWEFVQYFSNDPARRNDYSLPD